MAPYLPIKHCIGKRGAPITWILGVGITVVVTDRITKWLIQKNLQFSEEKEVIKGLFRLVHWGNTGAAWSLLKGYNDILLVVGIIAIILLFTLSNHFDIHTIKGRIALGLMLGGIVGNSIDRLLVGHVIDFLYFYTTVGGNGEVGFPAFNIADASICTGAALVLLNAWSKGKSSGSPPLEQAINPRENSGNSPN